ncbi:MAG: c-type cytochrome [Candidatus Latescibacteria bacterium]|nr:c-type cytochrome [Candidatus Latescibacterota bacterium]
MVRSIFYNIGMQAPLRVLICALWVLAGCGAGEEAPAQTDGPELAAQITTGKRLFMSNGCALCHGESGDGEGRIAHTLSPAPRNFADVRTYKQGNQAEHIAFSIANGLGDGGAMPSYPHISAADRQAMAQFIYSLQDEGASKGGGE